MKTAMYLRKSRADEQEADALSRHRDTLMEFAAKNNLIIVKTYEEVVSGDSLFARPQMLKLLNDIENGKYEAVLCMDIDRLGRGDMQEQGLIMNTFRNAGTNIITPREVYNPQNESDEMLFEFKGIIARNELKTIKRRMLEGTKRTIANGGYVAEPPYGYLRVYKDKIPTLEIDPETADNVRLVFDMYARQGMGTHIIADALNSMGAKTRRGFSFSRNSVRFILQNITYTGKVQWNKNKHIRKNGTHKRKITPKEEWIVSDGLHEPIIDSKTFNTVQEIRSSRSHPPSNIGEIKNPLAGLVVCGICGKKLVRQNLKKRYNAPRLICNTKGCVRSVLISHVEKKLYDEILQFVRDCELATPEVEKEDATLAAVAGIKKQLAVLAQQKDKLHDLLEQGVYDIDTFMERKSKLQDEIGSANKNLKKLQQKQAAKTRLDCLPHAKAAADTYWSLTAADKNALLKEFISEIIYEKSKTQRNENFIMQVKYLFEKSL